MAASGSQRERVGDERLIEETGRGWEEWLAALDDAGAAELRHPEIVRLIADLEDGLSGWWEQTIAVGYEQERGLREVGETASQGFEIGVRRTVPLSPAAAWDAATGADALGKWLGGWIPDLREGARFTAVNESVGEVRTIKPGERIRLRWRPARTEADTVVQLTVAPAATGATIGIHQEKLADNAQRELMRGYWKRALEEFAAGLAERSATEG